MEVQRQNCYAICWPLRALWEALCVCVVASATTLWFPGSAPQSPDFVPAAAPGTPLCPALPLFESGLPQNLTPHGCGSGAAGRPTYSFLPGCRVPLPWLAVLFSDPEGSSTRVCSRGKLRPGEEAVAKLEKGDPDLRLAMASLEEAVVLGAPRELCFFSSGHSWLCGCPSGPLGRSLHRGRLSFLQEVVRPFIPDPLDNAWLKTQMHPPQAPSEFKEI